MNFPIFEKFNSVPFFESKNLNEKVHWFFLSLVLIFIAIVRYRLLDFPLERDEGEYAYMGQLILDGIPPYKLAYNMKLPGTYLMYAIIMGFFGETIRGIHLGYMLLNLATVVLIYIFVKRLCNSFVGLITASAYGIYALSPFVLGFAAHATHFVLFWGVLAVNSLLSTYEKKSTIQFFWTGVLFGIAFLMKQQAIFLILFSGFYFLYLSYDEYKSGIFDFKKAVQKGLLLVLGTLFPFVITVLILLYVGVFENFWYWTFQYASQYTNLSSIHDGWKNFSETVFIMSLGLYYVVAFLVLGFILQFFIKQETYKKVFLLLLILFSFLTTTPGLYFRQHYFIVFLPFLFIYLGIAFEFFRKILLFKLNVIVASLLIIILFLYVFKLKTHKDYYFKVDTNLISRAVYAENPFPESVVIGDYIKANSSESDTIAILGSEPQICFYANRKSATGFIYMYPLFETHLYSKEMQLNMIKDLEEKNVSYLVYVNKAINMSWGISKNSETLLLDWIEKNKNEKYELVGIADIISQTETVYKWGNEANKYKPKTSHFIEILKKK